MTHLLPFSLFHCHPRKSLSLMSLRWFRHFLATANWSHRFFKISQSVASLLWSTKARYFTQKMCVHDRERWRGIRFRIKLSGGWFWLHGLRNHGWSVSDVDQQNIKSMRVQTRVRIKQTTRIVQLSRLLQGRLGSVRPRRSPPRRRILAGRGVCCWACRS